MVTWDGQRCYSAIALLRFINEFILLMRHFSNVTYLYILICFCDIRGTQMTTQTRYLEGNNPRCTAIPTDIYRISTCKILYSCFILCYEENAASRKSTDSVESCVSISAGMVLVSICALRHVAMTSTFIH